MIAMDLDGRPVDGFQGEILEYWVNLECAFCGIEATGR